MNKLVFKLGSQNDFVVLSCFFPLVEVAMDILREHVVHNFSLELEICFVLNVLFTNYFLLICFNVCVYLFFNRKPHNFFFLDLFIMSESIKDALNCHLAMKAYKLDGRHVLSLQISRMHHLFFPSFEHMAHFYRSNVF